MNRFKQLREEKGLKQVDLAAKLNISQSTLSNWERGIHDPDNESLMSLASFFDCSVDYLLNNSDVKSVETSFYSSQDLDQAFFRMAQDAKESGLHPQDLQMAIDFLKRAKQRSEEAR